MQEEVIFFSVAMAGQHLSHLLKEFQYLVNEKVVINERKFGQINSEIQALGIMIFTPAQRLLLRYSHNYI